MSVNVINGVRHTDRMCMFCFQKGTIELCGGVFGPDRTASCWYCGGTGKEPLIRWNWQLGPHPDTLRPLTDPLYGEDGRLRPGMAL